MRSPEPTGSDAVHRTKDPSGNFSAKMNVPAQGTFDYPATVGYEQDSVVFRVEKPADAYFKGKIKADSIVGEWHNYGKKFPLTLRKSVDRIKLRPQYPQPPFPYAEQDVIYYNGDSSIRYGATLTLPEKGERFPVALLITGSGQQGPERNAVRSPAVPRDRRLPGTPRNRRTARGRPRMRPDDRGSAAGYIRGFRPRRTGRRPLSEKPARNRPGEDRTGRTQRRRTDRADRRAGQSGHRLYRFAGRTRACRVSKYSCPSRNTP